MDKLYSPPQRPVSIWKLMEEPQHMHCSMDFCTICTNWMCCCTSLHCGQHWMEQKVILLLALPTFITTQEWQHAISNSLETKSQQWWGAFVFVFFLNLFKIVRWHETDRENWMLELYSIPSLLMFKNLEYFLMLQLISQKKLNHLSGCNILQDS